MDQNAFLTIDQVCQELHISRWTVGRWIDTGKLSAKKIGRRVLIYRSEVERLLGESNVVIARGLPASQTWFTQVTPEIVAEGAELISAVLRKSGVEVNTDGLKRIITGAEQPTPVFWNSLILGLSRVLAPERGGVVPEAQVEIRRGLERWDSQGRRQRLWDPATWAGSTDPNKNEE